MGSLLAGHDAQVTVVGWTAVVGYIHAGICIYSDDMQKIDRW